MTTAVGNSAVGTDTLIGLSAGADLTGESLPVGRITVITGAVITESEFTLLPLDAVLIRSLDDFEAVGSSDAKSFLVTESGFPLAAELLGLGVLSPKAPITWSLQAPLNETLEQLGLLGLPERIAVHTVRGTFDKVVVGTAEDGAGRLDLESFQAGLAVNASLLGRDYVYQAPEPDEILQELNVLRSKHLSLLEVLIPAPVEVETPMVPAEDVRKLEDELSLQERRHEALDGKYRALETEHQTLDGRYHALDGKYQALETEYHALESKYHVLNSRYNALANSRLGKLTLRLWERKTSRANKAQSKEEK
ncbi:hypothetical protein [Paenarthrobacter sp. FR1]|uniref:hypothetical protein n=1 Tax=Paenarthrobacter sp. FR1 TaxID=3439548 RepID=UPI003DA500F2